MRTVKALLITVTGLLLCVPAYAQMNAGAEIEMSLNNTSAQVEDGEGSQGYVQQKADVLLNYTKDKVTGLVQFDLFAPKLASEVDTTATPATAATASNMLDDAWVQVAFSDTFKLKMGLESVYNNFYGRLSNAYTAYGTSHLPYSTPVEMVELSGAASGVSYGLQMWENEESVDEDGKDMDTGLFTNYAVNVQYNMPILEAGLIYVLNKGFKFSDTVETKDQTGSQIYVKYMNAALKLDAYLRMHQAIIDADAQEEGTSTVVGVGYKATDVVGVGFAYDMISPAIVKDGDKDNYSVMDLNVSYLAAPEVKYYVQYTGFGESAEKGAVAKAYTQIALGMKAKI